MKTMAKSLPECHSIRLVRNPRGIAKTEIAALILPSISLVDERPTARVIAEA